VIDVIRGHVDEVGCLNQIRTPVYAHWAASGFQDGSFEFPFDTVEECLRIVAPTGTVYIHSGTYPETAIIWGPVRLDHYGEVGVPAIVGTP
jgi:hypothetical protein